MTGYAAQTLPNGVRHAAIHYSADEEKNGGWVSSMRARMASDEGKGNRDWKREMELYEDIYEGDPVFADYFDEMHCPRDYREGSLPMLKGSRYLGGWDCGMTLQPAFVLLAITTGGQVHALGEVIAPAPEAMETFAPRVGRFLSSKLPAQWDEVEHYADATVVQRSGVDMRTAGGEAARHGFRLKAMSNIWQPRYSAVTWLLADRIDDETPRFMVSGPDCPVLRTGFKGAYKYEEAKNSDVVGPGRILRMPKKDSYSHIQDALQYAAMIARREVTKGPVKRQGLRR